MDVSELIRTARRQAFVSTAGAGARLSLYGSAWPGAGVATSAPALTITLATPIGIVDSTGVALAQTDYAQALVSADIIWARLTRADGQYLGDLTAGLAADDPVPELILPIRQIFAGAFYRLVGSHIVCD